MNDRLKFKVWNKEDKKFEDEDFYPNCKKKTLRFS